MPHVPAPTILVVDDDAVLNLMLCRAMRQAGYHVLSASDGLDALGCLKRHPVDLIVSDVVMPMLDGVALCMRVRAEPAWSQIPIVMMTGADPQAFPPQLATHVLQKPLALDALDRLVGDLLPHRL
jgi:CheY-like chemotaxis protein